MLRDHIQHVLRWLAHVIREPRSELNRWQRAVRFGYDLFRHGARQLREDRAPQMAAALSFQSLFGLVPVLVVTMIVVHSTMGLAEFRKVVEEVLSSLGLSEVRLSLAAETETGTGTAAAPSISLQDWLEGLISQAAQVNVAAVGWVGFVLIVYAALSLLVTIENGFNTIYRAPEGRPWTRRGPIYWSLLTFSPLMLGLTAYLHGRAEDWTAALNWGPWAAATMAILWSLSLGWLFWFAVYSLVPNTSVAWKPAAVGALLCVVLLEIGKRTLGAYLTNAFAAHQLYGSLGLIPLFMFWVYLMWLAVLFGLEVSAILQYVGDGRLEEIETRHAFTGLIEPAAVVTVMEVVAGEFQTGRGATQRHIADVTGIHERIVALIVDELCATGLLHRLEHGEHTVCLAQPADEVTADRLMDVGFRLADSGNEGRITSLLQQLREAQRRLAAEVTLAALVAHPVANAKPA
jgi:membrane protein